MRSLAAVPAELDEHEREILLVARDTLGIKAQRHGRETFEER